jgi:putative phosphoesterase
MESVLRVAALYDIHGNLPALEAVLDELRQTGIDRLIVGGDVVPGPMPRETLERLRALDIPVQFIRGNGDREVAASMRGEETGAVPPRVRDIIRWNAEQLPADWERVISAWPETLRLPIQGLGEVMFCHATPQSDSEIFTRSTADNVLLRLFEDVKAPLAVCGHTHMQFDRTVGTTRIVNAGSVGMPFGEPGAYWLLLGPDVRLRRTSFDFEKAAARIRETKYPHAEDFAATNILRPPSESDMLEAFNRTAKH